MSHSTKSLLWRWIFFLPKAYIIAVPIAVLLEQFFVNHFLLNDAHLTSYWDARQQARMIARVWKSEFQFITWGYVISLVVLFFQAAAAYNQQRKGEVRMALIFAMLALISLCFWGVAAFFAI